MPLKLLLFSLFIALLYVGCDTPAKKKITKKRGAKEVAKKVDDHENILFIGNSYTYRNGGLDYHLRNLSANIEGVNTTYVSRAAKGKYHLYTHWSDAKTWLKLISKKWDKVILQEYSNGPVEEVKEFMQFGEKWNGRLKRMNPTTQVYLFSTWGYKETKSMTDSLYNHYAELEEKIGASMVPVGLLWKALKNKINLYDGDGAHPNRKGTFITACLFYEHLYSKDVRETANNDIKLSPELQIKLKEWAHEFYHNYHDLGMESVL